MAPPGTESDIQLTGLKLDDVVNSVRSGTKVIFLDACRDNPLLIQSLASSRGLPARGLAPEIASNLQPPGPGGGIFIAYATDSGAVAFDGQGPHSPFTQALLNHLKDALSLDDMFSLVTKEVRSATHDTQRPYKYASLEGIVCLPSACASKDTPSKTALSNPAQQTGSELVALEQELRDNPQIPDRAHVEARIAALKRATFKEWVLYDLLNKRYPWYIKLPSVEPLSNSVAVI